MTTSNSHSDAYLQTQDAVVHVFGDDGRFPNNERLPLVLYQNAVKLPERDPAAIFEAILLESMGAIMPRTSLLDPCV